MAAPHEHCATTTVTAALRASGLTATALFEGSTSGARFRAWVADTLIPVLRPSDAVVLDNLNVHKYPYAPRVRQVSLRPARAGRGGAPGPDALCADGP